MRFAPNIFASLIAAALMLANANTIRATQTSAPTQESAPGIACFGTFGSGVTCLTEKGWQNYNKAGKQIGGDQITALAQCPDGRLLVGHAAGAHVFDGKKWAEYKLRGVTSPSGIACDAKNNVWLSHYGGVSQFDGKKWTTYPASSFAKDEDASVSALVKDIAVAPNGAVWVATLNSIARFDGKTWTVYREGNGFSKKYFFEKITLDAKGYPRAAVNGGVLAFDGKSWELLENRDLLNPQATLVDADGRILVGDDNGLFLYEDGAWSRIAEEKLGDRSVRSLAIDKRGRLWIGTDYGLHIVKDDQWTHYYMHNSDLASNDIRVILTQGNGPALPKPISKKPGSISGSLVKDNKPLANVKVEVCVRPLGFFYKGDTPCASQPFFKSALTDKAGKFRVTDLPVGNYVLTAEGAPGKWAQLTAFFGGSEFVPVAAGKDTALGELTVEEK